MAVSKPDIGALLAPKAVAVVGASPDTESLRGRIMRVLIGNAYKGQLFPISRSHTEVMGLKAYRSVAELPVRPDLAILIIPAVGVAEELERCGKAGVRAAVILSSGFAEAAGEAGAGMQAEVRAIAERYGMAVMGPNSEGFANTALGLCPTFSPAMEVTARPLLPPAGLEGQLAVIAQSGGIGFAFFDHGRAKELSFRYVVTTGNEACLEVLDFAEYILNEGKSDALILLLEDVKSPDTLRRVAEMALKAGKPLIVNKIGQSNAGARAAASHTAALAGSYAAYQAMFERYGIIEGRDIGEMVDMAAGFMAWGSRLPRGKRVGICTGSGGGGGWMADACAAAGLEVPVLDAATRRRIDTILPSYGTSQNPVDGTAQAIHKVGYGGLAELVAASPEVDGVITVMTARSSANLQQQREKLVQVAAQSDKPILAWSYTLPGPGAVEVLAQAGYPLFANIQGCARTMRAMADYRALRERWLTPIEIASTPASACPAQTHPALEAANAVLCEWEARPVLAAYGIGTNPCGALVNSAAAAATAAREMGGPVALKVQSPDIVHKTEAGALALNLSSATEIKAAYARVLANARRHAPGARILGVLVQPMAPPGHEMLVGIKRDAAFGPMLLVGLGGVHTEVLRDTVLAPLPLSEAQAHAMIRRLKGAALLGGYRGGPPADVEALVDLMVRLAGFATSYSTEVAEVDLNPVIVHARGKGVSVVDALIVKAARDAPR